MKKQKKYKNVIDIINDLNDSLYFLSHSFKIPGRTVDDLKQSMIQNIIEIYHKNPKYFKKRKKGFWFIRSRWFLLNLRKNTFKRDPLAKAISIDNLINDYGEEN